MKNKRVFAFVMALVLAFSCIPDRAFAETESTSGIEKMDFLDIPKDWSTSALTNAADNGLLKGYKEGDGLYIKPNATLTRAEIAAIVNRAFGSTETTTLKDVADVSSDAWYAKEIAKAVHMGTMSLATTMRPDEKITRQEAFSILARAFQVKSSDSKYSALNAFQDEDNIAIWAKESICALVEKGVLFGNNGNINPTANITRAEFAKIMDNMIQQYINTPGMVTKVATSGNVMVNVAGVTLSNITVNGDLIIGDGVGSGEVTLDSVKVTGETIVRGGGVHSVVIKGNSSIGKIIIAKVDGDVRVAVEGDAHVEVVVIDDGKEDVLIEGKLGAVEVAADVPLVLQNASVKKMEVTIAKASVTLDEGTTITDLYILEGAQGARVNVGGVVTKLTNQATKANLIVSGTVSTIEVADSADGTNLEVGKDANVGNLKNFADISQSGEGKVGITTGNGTVTKSDANTDKTSTPTASTTGGSSSGGSSSGSKTNGFAGGKGTVSNTWQVATAGQLDRVRNYLDGHFVLIADIDLATYSNWTPIGAYQPADAANYDYSADTKYAFTGSFDGAGFAINNLTITRDDLGANDMTGTGLFGGIAGTASIQNLKIRDVTISSSGSCTGALVGMAMSSNANAIKDISLTGTNNISGGGSIAGLVGSAQDTNIINCSATANVTMAQVSNGAGILGGGLEGGIISGCTATGTVTATQSMSYNGTTVGAIGVGGLAGCAFDSEEVIDCTAEDVVIHVGEGAIMVGGLLGYSGVVNEGYFASDEEGFTLIQNCETHNVAITAETGATRIGGIVGSGFCGQNYNSYYPASSAMHIIGCQPNGTITAADSDAIVGSVLGYAFRNCAVVSCDGSGITGATNQVGAADAAQAVVLADVDSAHITAEVKEAEFIQPSSDGLTEITEAESFVVGDGTEENPWQITSAEELALMKEHLDGHYILMNDIDLSGKLWQPVGAYVPNDAASYDYTADLDIAFTGSLDGDGNTISNLTIIREGLGAKDMTGTGLFGGIAGEASIHDLTIENATVFSTGSCTGTLVGMSMSSNDDAIKNITLKGGNSIMGSGSVGGIIGSAQDTDITDCSADAEIIMLAASNGAGILGGGIEGGIISGCLATGTVTAIAATETYGAIGVGGLLGCAFDSEKVVDCHVENATITVGTNAIMVGGLLGYAGVVNEGYLASDAKGFTLIKNCEVTGMNIEAQAGSTRIGGIVGSGFCGSNYSSYYPASSAIHIVGCSSSGTIMAKSDDALVGTILGYAFRNCAVVSCDGSYVTGAINQVGAADTAQVVLLENIK